MRRAAARALGPGATAWRAGRRATAAAGRLATALAALVVSGLALEGAPGTGIPGIARELSAQEPARDTLDATDPAVPETPRLFRIGIAGGALAWDDGGQGVSLDDGSLWGLDIESRPNRFLAFRASGAWGRGAAAGVDTTGAPASTDLSQWIADLAAVGRLGIGPLERAGLVPFGTVGLGTVVHDPVQEGLLTASQSAFSFGAGLDLDISASFGGRAEWRRYRVEVEDPFDPMDRAGTTRTADRFFASLYWKI